MTDRVLVIGYGNVLRTDDGLGRRAAELMAGHPRLDGAEVIDCHQLTPELALDVSAADHVILIDAIHGPPAGTYTIERVEPTGSRQTPISHQVSPAGLLDLAGELYGSAPDVDLVSVGVESFEFGDRLSRTVEEALPGLIDAVVDLVHRRIGVTAAASIPGRGHA